MKFFSARGASLFTLLSSGASLLILLSSMASTAWCQDTGPGLFPLPPLPTVPNYPVRRAAANDALWGQAEPSPVPQVGELPRPASDQSVLGPEYLDAMKGGYDGSCTSVASPCGGSACCHNHYVYANALVMTHNKMGGFVTSTDSITGNARLFFCNQEFGNLWAGGLEVGT